MRATGPLCCREWAQMRALQEGHHWWCEGTAEALRCARAT